MSSPLPVSDVAHVVVIDDQPLYRAALAGVLEARPDLQLAGEAGDESGALATVRRVQPEVAVVGLNASRFAGRRVLEELAGQETRVLVLAAPGERLSSYDALQVGAAGYLGKEACAEAIADAILAVARGETVLDPQAASSLAAEIAHRGERVAGLTSRECEILRLVAAG